MKWFIILVVLISACSITKKSQRQLRRANKLIMKAKSVSPQLFDTVYITKRDTVILTKDSLVTKLKLTLDSTKVDSLVEKLIELKTKGLETRTITKLIYEEVLPDLTYNSKDSLRVDVDGKQHWIRFNIDVKIRNDELQIITKPLNNVPIITQTAVINIDAKKEGKFWKGFKWGTISILVLVIVLWFFRGVLGVWIKQF